MIKYRPKLTSEEKNELNRLSQIDFSNYSEADVREEFIVPLLVILGYRKNQDYSVSREDSFSLNDVFLSIGSKQIRLDYLFSVRKQFFWLIDAKKGSGNKEIQNEDIYQAYFYSQHPEIDAIYFAVCNGWYFNLYERSGIESSTEPVLSIPSKDISDRFMELDQIIGATQILPTLKQNLLEKTKKILSAEVALERLNEYLESTQKVIREVRPTVLDNFRKNSKIVEKNRKESYEEMIKSLNPFQILDSLFLSANTMGEIKRNSELIIESERFKVGHSQHFLFFHNLFLEELRPINYLYHMNSVYFLIQLKKRGVESVDYRFNGSDKASVIDLLNDKLLDIYTFHKKRKDLRILSLYEGLNYRFFKYFLVMGGKTRKHILDKVNFNRYYLPEEEIAWLGPNPAKELIELVLNTSTISLNYFLDQFYDKGERKFKENLAIDYYNSLLDTFNKSFKIHSAKYSQVLSELGSSWSELMWLDSIYSYSNPVISAVSKFLLSESEIFEDVSEEVIEVIKHVNSLKISNYTDKLCKQHSIASRELSEEDRMREVNSFYSL